MEKASATPLLEATKDEGFEMSKAERAAWFLESPRHQSTKRSERVANEYVWDATFNYIDVAESGSYLHVFDDGSALLQHGDEIVVFKRAGITDAA